MSDLEVNRQNLSKAGGRAGAFMVALLVGAGVLPVLVSAAPAQAAPSALAAPAQSSPSALADPLANVPRTAAMGLACGAGPGSACQAAVAHAIDRARAAEGVRALALPADYGSLSAPGQLLVLTDLERVDRGLPGFTTLSSGLNAMAEKAAISNSDPIGPAGSTWGSNWAGGEASALFADYDLMYNDGSGSPNVDCSSTSARGCWDHRQNILGAYGPHPYMGAAVARVHGVTSMTELLSSSTPVTSRHGVQP